MSHLTAHLDLRRSSRVRMRPLEHWNFEKMTVEMNEDGEVQVIHEKQDSNQNIKKTIIDPSVALGSHQGIPPCDKKDTTKALPRRRRVTSEGKDGVHSTMKRNPIKSPTRQKLIDNFNEDPVEEESSVMKSTVGGGKIIIFVIMSLF